MLYPNARIRPFAQPHQSRLLIYRQRKNHNVNKSRLSASITQQRRVGRPRFLPACSFHPPLSLPPSCPARFPTHSYLALEGLSRLASTKLRLLALISDRNLAPCSDPSRPIIRASPFCVSLQKLLCLVDHLNLLPSHTTSSPTVQRIPVPLHASLLIAIRL